MADVESVKISPIPASATIEEDVAMDEAPETALPSEPVPSADNVTQAAPEESVMSPEDLSTTTPAPASSRPEAPPERKRPKLDVSGLLGGAGRERRKGKSIFGVVLGTLNKAKAEDKQRNASEAAKKRQEIDERLQKKLAREQNIVRKQDESRKERITAVRLNEDLAVKDSIVTYRYTYVPLLSNFLFTSDIIPAISDPAAPVEPANDDAEMVVESSPKPPTGPSSLKSKAAPSVSQIFPPPTSHPPPISYLPIKLLPSQELFLAKRKASALEKVTAERDAWATEKEKELGEIKRLKEESEAKREEVETELEKNATEEKEREDVSQSAQAPNGKDAVVADDSDMKDQNESEEKAAITGASETATAPPTTATSAPPRAADAMEQDEEAVEY